MGTFHVKAWNRCADAEVLCVVDLIPERARTLADEFNVATVYTDYEEALAHDGVNVVSVCVPTCYHRDISVLAASKGQHVMCEKPLALTLEQADDIIRAVDKNGVTLSIGHQRRWHGDVQIYRELYQNGSFGSPVIMRNGFIAEVRPKLEMHSQSMNGGPVIDLGVHHFDMWRYIFGSEAVSVSAAGFISGKGKPRLKTIKDFAIDTATVTVKFASGDIGTFFVCWGMPEEFPMSMDEMVLGPLMTAKRIGADKVVLQYADRSEEREVDTGDTHSHILDFADAILQNRKPLITAEDGRAGLKIALAALRSIETGETITL